MRDSEIRALQGTLLACPHCAGTAKLEAMRPTQMWFRARCDDYTCGATTWAMIGPEAAVKAWNRRDGEA